MHGRRISQDDEGSRPETGRRLADSGMRGQKGANVGNSWQGGAGGEEDPERAGAPQLEACPLCQAAGRPLHMLAQGKDCGRGRIRHLRPNSCNTSSLTAAVTMGVSGCGCCSPGNANTIKFAQKVLRLS